jgi:hypothetical protein
MAHVEPISPFQTCLSLVPEFLWSSKKPLFREALMTPGMLFCLCPSRKIVFLPPRTPLLIRPRRNQVAHVRWILIFASFTMPLHSLRIGQGEVNGVPKHAARLLHAAIPKAPPFGQFMGPNPAHPALGRFAPRIPPREGRDGGGVFARPMNKLGEGGPRFPPIPKETRKAAHCPAHSWCGMPLATRSSHTFLYPT